MSASLTFNWLLYRIPARDSSSLTWQLLALHLVMICSLTGQHRHEEAILCDSARRVWFYPSISAASTQQPFLLGQRFAYSLAERTNSVFFFFFFFCCLLFSKRHLVVLFILPSKYLVTLAPSFHLHSQSAQKNRTKIPYGHYCQLFYFRCPPFLLKQMQQSPSWLPFCLFSSLLW